MFQIEFYENADGVSELWNFLEELRKRSRSGKDARIQYKQIAMYISLLEQNGTQMPETITKHLGDGIWELRPGKNRVFYFFFENDTYVLLHRFQKKSQKTPRRELERAKAERADYLSRRKGSAPS